VLNVTRSRRGGSEMNLSRIGMDIAKNVFQLHGVDRHDKPILNKRLSRGELLKFFDALPAKCEVGIEACSAAHHWARELGKRGFSVKLIAPQFVKPYVKTNKSDANDAQAICEAMSRPSMRFVPIKSVAQQDALAVHRIRAEIVCQRTAKVNQARGLLAEYGVVLAKSVGTIRRALPILIEDVEGQLSAQFKALLEGLRSDLSALDKRIEELDELIVRHVQEDPAAKRLLQIPGIGPMSASALVASVGDASAFKRGRDMAAWLGLVPRQHSSGERRNLLGISKRGDKYLRCLLVHGARAAHRVAANKDDGRSRWVTALSSRTHSNVAVVALANKNARIAWALLTTNKDYDANARAAV
jgi:transposase